MPFYKDSVINRQFAQLSQYRRFSPPTKTTETVTSLVRLSRFALRDSPITRMRLVDPDQPLITGLSCIILRFWSILNNVFTSHYILRKCLLLWYYLLVKKNTKNNCFVATKMVTAMRLKRVHEKFSRKACTCP